MDFSDTPWLVRLTGLVALFLNIGGLLVASDVRLKFLLTAGSVFWGLQNWLLGAYTAAAVTSVSVVRQATSVKLHYRTFKVRGLAALFFAVLTLSAGLLVWQGWADVFSLCAALTGTVATFLFSGWRLRLALLLATVFWVASGVAYSAWEQALSGCISASAALLGFYRSTRKEQQQTTDLPRTLKDVR